MKYGVFKMVLSLSLCENATKKLNGPWPGLELRRHRVCNLVKGAS